MLPDKIAAFLDAAGWRGADAVPLAGDASNRRYLRVRRGAESAVLMDAPPERGEDVRPFVAIARHLGRLGLSAPRVLAEDASGGLLLLEDLGDDLYARHLARDPAREADLYAAAVDVLLALHRHPAPADLPAYDSRTMPEPGALALDWYVHDGDPDADPATRAALLGALRDALAPFDAAPRVLVQRDYHAQNLLWLPHRTGAARVGLLDFQDAAAGHPAYDLVSLVEDARRDVSPEAARSCLARYAAGCGIDAATLAAACAAMGAQRNLRILGVFARLSLHFGKPSYVDLIPRVWRHLQTDLRHPDLAPLAAWCAAHLPPPDPQRLTRLKDRCATVPTP